MRNTFVLFLFIVLCTSQVALAQLKNMDKRIENKVKQRVDRKADRTVDKALDKTEKKVDDGVSGKGKDDKSKPNKSNEEKSKPEANTKANEKSSTPETTVIRNADFTPGEKILLSERFEKDAPGDFPAAWNTTGSGEIVSFNNAPGKWLMIPHNTLTYPENAKAFPENFTIEFDLMIPKDNRPPIQFGFSEAKNPVKENIRYKGIFTFNIYNAQDKIETSDKAYFGGGNSKNFAASKYAGKPVHIAIAVNKTRIRLYVEDEKVFDLPKAFEPASIRNSFFFKASEITSQKNPFYITNYVVAETGTDARSGIVKDLMENGNVSTNDIQFDFNSDQLTTSSHDVVNMIGDALKQYPELRIKIVGHTDNVGKDDYNKELSGKRANSVKKFLTDRHGIDPKRIETEGKGATSPAVPNTTEEGRAKNRRVEFIKLQ